MLTVIIHSCHKVTKTPSRTKNYPRASLCLGASVADCFKQHTETPQPAFSVEALPPSGYNQLDRKPLQIESLKRRSIIKIGEFTHPLWPAVDTRTRTR